MKGIVQLSDTFIINLNNISTISLHEGVGCLKPKLIIDGRSYYFKDDTTASKGYEKVITYINNKRLY